MIHDYSKSAVILCTAHLFFSDRHEHKIVGIAATTPSLPIRDCLALTLRSGTGDLDFLHPAGAAGASRAVAACEPVTNSEIEMVLGTPRQCHCVWTDFCPLNIVKA
jgi:hypothetical protein